MINKKNFPCYFLLAIIFVIGFILRFYDLGSIPNGFHIDEASLGYNGYSLLLTGKDENNNSFPFYVDMFGDNRPSGYHYLTILPIKFLGLTEFATRLPGAFFGAITIFALFFLSQIIFHDKRISLLSSFLIAFSPWHIVLSRASAEAVVALFFIIIGIIFLIKSLLNQKINYLFFGSLFMTISFFFYHTPRVFVPTLFLALLIFLSLPFLLKKINTKYNFALIGAFFLVCTISLSLIFFISGGTGRFSQVNIFSFPETKLVMLEQIREDGVAKNSILLTRFFHNKITNFSLTFIKNYLEYFSANFLFIKGGLPIWYAVPNMGLFYLIELPFFLAGLVFLVIKKEPFSRFILSWLILAPLTAALTVDDIPNINRTLVMLPAMILIISYGFVKVINGVSPKFYLSLIIIFFALFLYGFLYFFHQYFVHAPLHQNWYRNEGVREMMKVVKASYPTVDKVIVTKATGGIYPLILFYMQYDPEEYQKEKSPKDKDYSGFGKFFFVPQSCPSQQKDERFPKEQKILYVERGDCPNQGEKVKQIYQKDGNMIFQLVYE